MAGKKGTSLGNTNAMKFKTSKERKALCEAYCKHIESGFSDDCFPECDKETLYRYMKDFPSDFDTDLMAKAKRKRQLFWETVGITGTTGKLKGFNAKSWEFNMKNRFNWKDKQEIDSTNKMVYDVPGILNAVEEYDQSRGENGKPDRSSIDTTKEFGYYKNDVETGSSESHAGTGNSPSEA